MAEAASKHTDTHLRSPAPDDALTRCAAFLLLRAEAARFAAYGIGFKKGIALPLRCKQTITRCNDTHKRYLQVLLGTPAFGIALMSSEPIIATLSSSETRKAGKPSRIHTLASSTCIRLAHLTLEIACSVDLPQR